MSHTCAWCGRVGEDAPTSGWPWLPHNLCHACLNFIHPEAPEATEVSDVDAGLPTAGGYLVALALQSLRPKLSPAAWAPLWNVLVLGRPVVAVARERGLCPRALDRVAAAARGRLRALMATRTN